MYKTLLLMQITGVEKVMQARCRKVYGNAHTYHINAISISSDQETFISSDDLRVNLWHLDHTNQSFNVVDIKPPNMEDLTEVRQPQSSTSLHACMPSSPDYTRSIFLYVHHVHNQCNISRTCDCGNQSKRKICW